MTEKLESVKRKAVEKLLCEINEFKRLNENLDLTSEQFQEKVMTLYIEMKDKLKEWNSNSELNNLTTNDYLTQLGDKLEEIVKGMIEREPKYNLLITQIQKTIVENLINLIQNLKLKAS